MPMTGFWPLIPCPFPAEALTAIHSPLSTIHYPLSTPVFAQASPWVFGWLAALAIPILIHLWSRQKYREMSWAAMEYLLAAVRRSRQRIRLEQLLLLAIRTLLIVLVVAAVLQSLFKHVGFSAGIAGGTHRVLVIDGSYSMAYRPKKKSRFEGAKELAKQIVESGRQGDACTLVLMSSPPRVVVGTPALEPGELLEEIDQLRLPHSTADLPATVAAVLQVVKKVRRENPRLSYHEVYFLTDLGRVGWAPELTVEFQKRSKELAEAATLVVIDLGQPDSQNLAVTDVRAGEPVVTLAKSVAIRAKVKNFGPRACNRQRLELLVDGRSVGEAYVGEDSGLPPGGEASVEFSYRFEAPGDHDVEVRLLPETQDDALQIDNRRFLALPVKQYVQVLCINGRPSGEPYQDATDYLRVALSPEGKQGQHSVTRVEVAAESALREFDLDRYDCVFLVGVAQFVSSEAKLLQSYVKHGGGLVFFLGEGVKADSYNDELRSDKPGKVRLLPARLAPTAPEAPQGKFFYFDPRGYHHPIVSAFRGREGAGLLKTPVKKYVKLTVPKESKDSVALAFVGGDPAIVAEQIHRGRVVLVATSADRSWTPMPLLPTYVPIVQELLAFAMGGQLQQRNFLVGQPLRAFVAAPAADVPLDLRTPDGDSEQIRLRPEGDYSSWSYSETMTSGIYTARFAPPVSRSDLFAVNVDTVESDLRKLTPEQLREQVWSGIPFETSREDPEKQTVSRRIGRRGGFSKWLLCGALGLLFLETFLAWRFGHHPT